MSSKTYRRLEEAIAAHVADETNGNLLTDWALVTSSVSINMSITYYLDACSDNTPQHSLEGLLHRGLRRCIERDNYQEDED